MGPPIPARIPWRDMVLWCEQHPLVDLELLAHCAAAMDRVFLEHWAEQERKRQRDEEWRRQNTR